MSIFQPAQVTSAFLKMGLLGFQGGGKTKTAGKTATGLVQYMRAKKIEYANKPVAFFDTETGSDWLIPDFKAAGVELVVAKKRSFADLLKAMDDAEKNASVLIIDSITHPWRELCDSYLRQKQKTRLEMQDWGYLKGEHGWQQFTDRYVNSKLHIIICGRAGYEYDDYKDDEGKRKIEKTGVKMKTEGETGFEPSLLVLMERDMDMRTNHVTHRATVLKDRSTLLDGAEIDNPGFKDFLPHIELLNLGGHHVGVDASGDSQHILKVEKRDWQPVQRKIVLGEITDLLTLHFAGQKAEDKTARIKALLKHFDAGWTEIEEVMSLPALRAGYDSMYRELEGKPSRYATEAAGQQQTQTIKDAPSTAAGINDELPDHSAKPAEQTIKAQLLADIPNNKTISDCLTWALTVSTRKDLTAEDLNEINQALMKHQGDLVKASSENAEAGKAGANGAAGEPSPTGSRKRGGSRQPASADVPAS